MLTKKKYKSDKILNAVLIIIGISILVAYFTDQRQGLIIGLLLIAGTVFLGVSIYRDLKEGNKKDAMFQFIALIIIYSLFLVCINFLKIQL